jgi:hypothetical protein
MVSEKMAKSALTPAKFIKLGVGSGVAFVVAQFAFGSEKFYSDVVSFFKADLKTN